MERAKPKETLLVKLDLDGVPEGSVFQPLEPIRDAERALHETWERPLSSWGNFDVGAGMECLDDAGHSVLAFTGNEGWERAIIARGLDVRDGTFVAEVKQTSTDAIPSADIPVVSEALAGIVFRVQTSRAYYHFGIEGKRRAVLYRRNDDEWYVMAAQPVDLPEDYVTLRVRLDGDAIHCESAELGVAFHVTDTMYRAGKVGIRVTNQAKVRRFEVTQTEAEHRRDRVRREQAEVNLEKRGAHVPDAKIVRTYRLADLGGQPVFRDFVETGRFDMLVEGTHLRAFTSDGDSLWEVPERVRRCVFSRECGSEGRLIYGLAGTRDTNAGHSVQDELVVIEGRSGTILARTQLPPTAPDLTMWDLSPTSAALSSNDATDIILREWRADFENGGIDLWAYDRDLNLLWECSQDGSGAHLGHTYAIAFHDIDGDSRDEMLAGGVMYDSDGTVLWTHDRMEEMLHIYGAKHYDAVVLGDIAGSSEEDPTALLIAGSAGVFVVDAFTGETRAVHRIGHAQNYTIGKVRPDLPGTEVVVTTQWGNFGIVTLLSGRGERLWTIQPDYVGRGATPVKWGSAGHRFVWTNTSARAQAFYDGHGRLVKRLPELSRVWGGGMDRVRRGTVIHMGRDTRDYLTLVSEGVLYVFGPDE